MLVRIFAHNLKTAAVHFQTVSFILVFNVMQQHITIMLIAYNHSSQAVLIDSLSLKGRCVFLLPKWAFKCEN